MSLAYFFTKDYANALEHALNAASEVPNLPPAHGNQALAFVGMGEIEHAKAALETARRLGPAFVQSRLDGEMPYRQTEHRQRYMIFYRIAAGLEDPSAADALR